LFGLSKPEGEADDLTEIVGIGKVFEEMLHDLGIYHFRQIAAFAAEDIARINSELKEFKGRIEHDDWVGQAKELHFKKYGGVTP
jgi:NADH-quinone oxidoreductase subunit E